MFNGGNVNLFGTFETSKLKINSSFQKRREKQKQIKEQWKFVQQVFDKIDFVFCVSKKKIYPQIFIKFSPNVGYISIFCTS